MEIDPSLLLLLSNLLQLQSYLDPIPDPSSSSSLTSPSTFPLLFFALASAISSSLLSSPSVALPSPSPPLIPASLRPLSSDPIYSLDPATRDARFRSNFGISFSLFNSLLNSLIPHSPFPYLWRDPPETLQPAHALDSEWSMYNIAESLREALAEDLYERQQRTPTRVR
ncbi:putative nuclease HARBI1 [Carex littledalei]|uniref:Putative nuclease HARBI1 n=1 Tax=Carex littledalei TaxID=544730 RepID=A0A833VGR9_9POAL|nr:putative nuclease HARBI1 [Carex littledalei]